MHSAKQGWNRRKSKIKSFHYLRLWQEAGARKWGCATEGNVGKVTLWRAVLWEPGLESITRKEWSSPREGSRHSTWRRAGPLETDPVGLLPYHRSSLLPQPRSEPLLTRNNSKKGLKAFVKHYSVYCSFVWKINRFSFIHLNTTLTHLLSQDESLHILWKSDMDLSEERNPLVFPKGKAATWNMPEHLSSQQDLSLRVTILLTD